MAKLRSFFRRDSFDREISKELQAHIEMEVEHRRKQGMTEEEVRRTALRDFGGVEKTREEVREARGLGFWDVLRQDVRFGLRSLRRGPGFTVAAVLILALGIGANTAMFSVISGVLVKPLPFRDQGKITLIRQSAPGRNVADAGVSIPEYFDYRARLRSLHNLVEYHQMQFVLLNHGDPDKVDTGVVSTNFFGSLGVKPLLGRDFVTSEATLGSPPVVLLTYQYWQDKFGSDPKAVGQVVKMNDQNHEIIGVLPPFPQYPQVNDIYMPTSACPFRARSEANMATSHRIFSALVVFGWLNDGATPDQASAEIKNLATRFPADYAKDYRAGGQFTGRALMLNEELVRDAKPMVLALMGATLLVLIIASANVANLAIARTMRRSRELSVRTALGAGRGRITRQLVTEGLLVSVAGGVAGLLVARAFLVMLVPFIGRFTERTGDIHLDAGALLFTTLIAAVTGVICGVAPGIGERKNLVASMRDGTLQGGESRGRRRFRSALVLAQVTVSFVLLIGAALLLQSVARMAAVPLGFDSDHVVTADFRGNFSRLNTAEKQRDFVSNTLERLRSTPGVVAAAATASVPLTNIQPGKNPFAIVGRTPEPGETLVADANVASDGYFDALGVKVLEGREFRLSDSALSGPVVVINQTMAKFWHGDNPIGSSVSLQVPGPPGTPNVDALVVGVVADFRLYGATTEMQPQYFQPLSQGGGSGGQLIVRTTGDTGQLGSAIRQVVHSVDAEIPVEGIKTLSQLQRERLTSPALTAGLLTSFAGLALFITLAGITGLIGSAVSQRTREFGVRLALGAKPWSIVGNVVVEGVTLVGVGVAAGIGGAYLFSQVIVRYLFQTTPTDVAAYVAVAAVFVAAGAVAAFVPAKRITSIDPLKVLRTE